MVQQEGYREPSAAGSFYPGEPEILARRIRTFLEGEPTLPDPGPIGLICPHAGYDYSGGTAGRAYRELKGRPPEAVIVLGPSHYDRFRGATSWPGMGYRTPLGEVPYPRDIAELLLADADAEIHANRLGHREEHSVEVQIPFLQEVAPGVPVLPLVIADVRSETCSQIGKVLARAVGSRRVVIVASSDLYHGHSNRECRETDARTLGALERNDAADLVDGFQTGLLQACGRGPILAALEACRELGATHVRVLSRTNSDEVTGRSGGYVVGYAAAAITRR